MQPLLTLTHWIGELKVLCMRMLGISVRHECDGLFIDLPPGHLLPLYFRKHPQYDRFLPSLVRFLGQGGVVIDVGANVGDTLASMVASNPRLQYVCVEPDDEFFAYLQRNTDRLRSAHHGIDVKLFKELIGSQTKEGVLQGRNGTKTVVQGDGKALKFRRMDNVLDDASHASVKLLKSDVDGFDADVIRSADSVLRASHPVLYFEMHHANEAQMKSFVDVLSYVQSIGYDEWVVFDNFGAKMLRTRDLTVLLQLMNYIHLQNVGVSTRTIFYFDILSFVPRDAGVVDLALRDHGSKFSGHLQDE